MDFDLKAFFKDPPRIREEVKTHIHNLATRIVERFAEHVHALQIERILPRHVRLVFLHMSQDPLTRMTRNGLCVQQTKVKNMSKVFQRALDTAEENLKVDAKYAGLEKKIVKGTQEVLNNLDVRHSTGASVCVAACVAEVCGIILNSTQNLMEDRTVSLSAVQTHGTTYCLSSGAHCVNSSLVRFLHYIKTPLFQEILPQSTSKEEDRSKCEKPKPTKESPTKKFRRLESKTVSFQPEARPQTPDTCFWED